MRRLASVFLAFTLAACVPVAAPPAKPEQEIRARIRTDLQAGNFVTALSRLARQVQAGRPESDFSSEYPQAISGVLTVAAGYMAKERHDVAGPLLRQALSAYPRTPNLARRIAKPPPAIRADLRLCAERLMEKGLLAYRAGRLEEAIGTWKRLLAFNPGHQPARQAAETASLQLRNLRAID